MKRKFIALGIIVLVVVISVFAVKAFLNSKYEASKEPFNSGNTEQISIIIPKGATAKTISKILEDRGIIGDSGFFLKYLKDTDKAKDLKAGTFALSSGMNADEIIKTLTEIPDVAVEKLVIPEGFDRNSIAKRIEEKGMGTAEEFLNLTKNASEYAEEFDFLKQLPEGATLEGYLFPATYEIKEKNVESIVKEMLSAYKSRYKKVIEPVIGDRNLQTIMTLASIVEKEARVDKDRPLIASVCYNRLEEDMPLQMDSTVQFARGERKEALNYDDLEVDSPYNTYKNKGLPPGPIANPGIPSIEAVLNPPETKYLYFVLTGEDGSHTFTETYEEHLKAKEKMIRP